jgi:signal transduction histidine kinase
MVSKKGTKYALAYALVYTIAIILIATIPIYAYITLSMEYAKFRQVQELKTHVLELERTIYSIPSETSTFVYPRSLLYRSGIYGSNGDKIFSLLKDEIIPTQMGVLEANGRLIYRQELYPNTLGASYLVVSRPLSYHQEIANTILLVAVVTLFVFGFSLLILSRTIAPFEEAARQMDRFFKDAMHELKTPLGVIRLNLEMLGEQLGENRAISRANSALIALSTVYEDIEYLIKHRRVEYRSESFDAKEALEGRLSFFGDLLEIKSLHVKLDLEPNIKLKMNRQEWQRIVDNTLSNAIKYTPAKGSIEVSLKKEADKAKLSFKDSGVGIEDTKAIFRRYYRGDAIKGGFGIGLSIVKQICEKYGIEIRVHSTRKKGSEFIYFFNLAL